MKKKVAKLAAVVAAAALSLTMVAGCSSTSAEEEVSYEPISVAYLNKAGYEDIIVADNQGFYAECGPEVTLNAVTGSGQQSVEALLAGSVDIAATGKGPVGDAVANYGDDIVILAGTNCATGDQVWVAGPSLTGDKQIVAYDAAADNKAEVKASFEAAAAANGGTICVGVQQGATTESEFKSWLKAMEISFNDYGTEGDGVVTLVDLKANTLPTALSTGTDIDMMAASQPYPDTAVAEIEGAYKIGDNSDINSYSVACLITTKEIYEQKEASIKAFLEAEKLAVDFMNENPEEATAICAESIGADEASVKAAFDIANFKVCLDEQRINVLQKVCVKKGADITVEELTAQMPLIDWMDTELNK